MPPLPLGAGGPILDWPLTEVCNRVKIGCLPERYSIILTCNSIYNIQTVPWTIIWYFSRKSVISFVFPPSCSFTWLVTLVKLLFLNRPKPYQVWMLVPHQFQQVEYQDRSKHQQQFFRPRLRLKRDLIWTTRFIGTALIGCRATSTPTWKVRKVTSTYRPYANIFYQD